MASEASFPGQHSWITDHSAVSGLVLLNDKAITISVIGGPSKGLTYHLTKPRASIGQTGRGADLQIDGPQVSAVHCVVGVTEDAVRLWDLVSENGTYVDGERVEAANLEHLSEFRIGSSLLLVGIWDEIKGER